MIERIADISSHDGDIDWGSARLALDFVIFRSSVGLKQDTKYINNTNLCGIPYAAYHYVKAATAEEAIAEANFFVECANKAWKKPVIYFADIEYEAQTETNTEEVCVAFLNRLRELGCEKIGMYINTRYKWAGKSIEMADIMWVPRWGKDDGQIPSNEYLPKHPYDIWQYTSNGSVVGIKGSVDLDILRDGLTVADLIGGVEEEKEIVVNSIGDILMLLVKAFLKFFNIKKN